MVDQVISVVDTALAKQGMSAKALERWKEEMPTEAEMRPKDKYTFFDRKAKGYRKGVHSEFGPFSMMFYLGEGGERGRGDDIYMGL